MGRRQLVVNRRRFRRQSGGLICFVAADLVAESGVNNHCSPSCPQEPRNVLGAGPIRKPDRAAVSVLAFAENLAAALVSTAENSDRLVQVVLVAGAGIV